jgi:hypothetical protein
MGMRSANRLYFARCYTMLIPQDGFDDRMPGGIATIEPHANASACKTRIKVSKLAIARIGWVGWKPIQNLGHFDQIVVVDIDPRNPGKVAVRALDS